MAQNVTPPDGLEFDPIEHKYTYKGQRLPSVTEIIDRRGMIKNKEFFTEEARVRGTAVHAAIEYDVAGDLDWSSVDPAIVPYLEGFEKFRRETQIRIAESEVQLAHPLYLYAGTIDLVGTIGGRIILADIKTGTHEKWHDLQLAAYDGLIEANRDYVINDWWVVYLNDRGTYQVHQTQDKCLARRRFLAALDLTKFIEN